MTIIDRMCEALEADKEGGDSHYSDGFDDAIEHATGIIRRIAAAGATEGEINAAAFIKFLHDYCDRQCKEYPHKTAENYAYWDIQDKIDTMFGRQEKL